MVASQRPGHMPTAVIPVGGKGTRLGLGEIPKSMVDICGLPLLERMIANLVAQGLKDIILLAGYGAPQIIRYFGERGHPGANIDIVVEENPLGTAGAFSLIRHKLTHGFLVFYGDILFDVNVERFVSWARKRKGHGTLYVHPNDHPFDSDLVDVDLDDRIVRFVSKPHNTVECGNLVSAGIYYLFPEILSAIPASVGATVDWGRDVFPKVASSRHPLFAYRGTEYVKDIGTPDRIRKGRRDFERGIVPSRSYRFEQRAIFLDRDGVLNREVGGVCRPDMLELMPDAGESLSRINASSFLAICVTNQPAVAKAFMTFDDLKRVHWELDAALARSGAFIDDLYFCPHHPQGGFEGEVTALKVDCACRKPKPGMLLLAAERHNINLTRSYLIGDDMRDVLAGAAAGVTTYLIEAHRSLSEHDGSFFHRSKSLKDAVNDILSEEKFTA